MKTIYKLILSTVFITSCTTKTEYIPIEGKWIKGTQTEQLKTIEDQFRGFDKTMVEVDYRYQELYWSGQDENWEYANYQLKKIEKTIKLGLQRRPKRAQSATHFLEYVIPEVNKAIQTENKQLFNTNFEMMRTNCTNCHISERVPTFTVRIPTHRQSPIGN